MSTGLIVFLILIMMVVTIIQLIKVNELSTQFTRGKDDEEHLEIPHADNKLNANIQKIWALVFLGGFTYLLAYYGNTLPKAASLHGEATDVLMDVNMIMIFIVFYAFHAVLFHFSIKYYYRPDRKATFFPHSTKLELIWTIVPSVVLIVIILFGLITWFDMTGKPEGNFNTVEITAKRFEWIVRYPGQDSTLGASNYNLIDTENRVGNTNNLGIVTPFAIDFKLKNIDKNIHDLELQLTEKIDLMSEDKEAFVKDEIYKYKRHKQRIMDIRDYEVDGVAAWAAGEDDVIKKELHLVVNKEVLMIFKSQDVIHSAYLPHFRAQMNCVPGGPNTFKMTPTITTEDMRKEEGQGEDFDYLLLCNKICGASHYGMQMKIVVETQREYDEWMESQTTYVPDENSDLE